jgi:hypothetical protein
MTLGRASAGVRASLQLAFWWRVSMARFDGAFRWRSFRGPIPGATAVAARLPVLARAA